MVDTIIPFYTPMLDITIATQLLKSIELTDLLLSKLEK